MNVDVTFYEYKYFIIFTTTIIIISYFSWFIFNYLLAIFIIINSFFYFFIISIWFWEYLTRGLIWHLSQNFHKALNLF